MELNIRTSGVELSPWLKQRIERKISRLDRYLAGIDEAWLEIKRGSAKAAKEREVVQLTLRANRIFLRAEERSDDILASLDAVLDKIYRQIERYKGRRWSRRHEETVPPEVEALEERPHIVRIKRHALMPMEEEEAIEQMELLGHDFFVFYNINDEQINVLYRRRDGNYGLIQPELG